MNTVFVIDACTMINLLRIDDDDDFLYKNLKSLNMHITDTVCDEIKKNIFKNYLSKDEKKRLQQIVPLIEYDFKNHSFNDIINDVGDETYQKIKTFVGHTKKDNGELVSATLSLYLSRYEQSMVILYTDDFPAKKEFSNLFNLQQIGKIEDSVDLLLFLYWFKDDFTIQRLKDKLRDLISEYNFCIKEFINYIEDELPNIKQRNIKEFFIKIKNAFYKNDMKTFFENIEKTKQINNRKVNDVLDKLPDLNKKSELVIKIDKVLENLKSYHIYKIA